MSIIYWMILIHYLLVFRETFSDMEVKEFVQRYDANQDSKVSAKEMNSKDFYENVSNIFHLYSKLSRCTGSYPSLPSPLAWVCPFVELIQIGLGEAGPWQGYAEAGPNLT